MFKVGVDGYGTAMFAQKAQDIFTDMLAGDMVLAERTMAGILKYLSSQRQLHTHPVLITVLGDIISG